MTKLTDAQRCLLDEWFGDWRIERDHSWPLQDTVVLHASAGSRSYIVKASCTSHHIDREIEAHEQLSGRFTGWAPRLVHASAAQRILVTEYLPGELVEGTDAELAQDTYQQAGARLRDLLIPGTVSKDYLERVKAKASQSIAAAGELVEPGQLAQLRDILSAIPGRPIALSFTHGGFQPRNWLMNDGQLFVIDFGRADQRHWTSDLVRLHSQQFVDHEPLKEAFFSGLQRELTAVDSDAFRIEQVQQAIGTVVWAHGIHDAEFEDHGRRMIRLILQEQEQQ